MTPTIDAPSSHTPTDGPWVSGILIPMLPVADLARSASFYCALLGLELRREFVQDGEVTGLALGRGDIGWGLNLRLQSSLAALADLRGEHPVVWRAEDRDALAAFREHAEGLGLTPATFEHDDAILVRVVDPDDIDVYVAVSKRPWNTFHGYTLQPSGYHATHSTALTHTGTTRQR